MKKCIVSLLLLTSFILISACNSNNTRTGFSEYDGTTRSYGIHANKVPYSKDTVVLTTEVDYYEPVFDY